MVTHNVATRTEIQEIKLKLDRAIGRGLGVQLSDRELYLVHAGFTGRLHTEGDHVLMVENLQPHDEIVNPDRCL